MFNSKINASPEIFDLSTENRLASTAETILYFDYYEKKKIINFWKFTTNNISARIFIKKKKIKKRIRSIDKMKIFDQKQFLMTLIQR